MCHLCQTVTTDTCDVYLIDNGILLCHLDQKGVRKISIADRGVIPSKEPGNVLLDFFCWDKNALTAHS